MLPGQMLLTHFIIAVYVGQMLLCQPILFLICWLMMLKNLVGTRVSPAFMLLGYDYYFYCNTVSYLILILVMWPTPLPKYVAAGICQYFYSEMGH